MTEWNDRNLVCSGEPCQTHPIIVHLELVNTVSIRNFEPCNHVSILVLHGHSNEGVNSYKLHLHVLTIIWNPVTLHKFLHNDRVNCVVLDCVIRRRFCFALSMMEGEWVPYDGKDMQMEFVRIDPFVRVTMA